MLISTEMKLYYNIVSGKYDKNTMFSLMIKKLMLQWHSSKGMSQFDFVFQTALKPYIFKGSRGRRNTKGNRKFGNGREI